MLCVYLSVYLSIINFFAKAHCHLKVKKGDTCTTICNTSHNKIKCKKSAFTLISVEDHPIISMPNNLFYTYYHMITTKLTNLL